MTTTSSSESVVLAPPKASDAGELDSAHAAIARRIIGNIVQASSPRVSPDGSQVAFVVSRVDMTNNTGISQIWLADTDGQRPARPLTSGPRDGQPAWSPDGRSLAFVSKRSERKRDTTLHLIPIGEAGEIRTLASMTDGVGDPTFSPDGHWVSFISRTPDARYSAKGVDDGDTSWQAPRKIERFFSTLNGEGWIFDRPAHVYLVPADGTAAPRNLTPGEFQHDGITWTPDSTAIVTSAARHETWDLDFDRNLHQVTTDGRLSTASSLGGQHVAPTTSPDGSSLAFLGYDGSETYPQNVHVGIVESSTGIHRWISRGLDRTFEPTVGTQAPQWVDNTTLLATAEDRGQTHLYQVFTDGRAPQALTSGAHSVKAFDSAGGTICASIGSVDSVADIYVIETSGEIRPLTSFAANYQAAVKPLVWERFAVPCTDGSGEIDAWIMRPDDFDATKKYPMLLNVHGGPHTQYGEVFFDEAQMQAAAGFVVLMSNPRGGSGREQSWGQAILGPNHPTTPGSGWGGVDTEDVLAVLDAALQRFTFCDADRVGMLGGSYGGYMATWLAGKHSDRFKAICSERAVNNLLTEEWTSDIATIFRVEHGPRHIDAPQDYEQLSPVRFVRDINVPMLLIHSEEDLRCPISQAEELFVALRLLGKDVTFYRFPGESHELSRSGSPIHRLQRAEIILDWFAQQLA